MLRCTTYSTSATTASTSRPEQAWGGWFSTTYYRTILLFFCARARRAQRRPPRRAGSEGGAERCKTRITMYYTYVLHNRCVVIVTWLTCQTLGGTLFVSILTSRTSQNLAHDHAIIPLSLALEDQSSYACIRMHP